MIYILVLIAAAISSVGLTRVGMLILTTICPGFFKRLDWIFMMQQLQEGLWEYGDTLIADKQDEREVEGEVRVPLIIASFCCALGLGELVSLLTNTGTVGAIVVTLIASQIPFLIGLALIGIGALILRVRAGNLRRASDGGLDGDSAAFEQVSPDDLEARLLEILAEEIDPGARRRLDAIVPGPGALARLQALTLLELPPKWVGGDSLEPHYPFPGDARTLDDRGKPSALKRSDPPDGLIILREGAGALNSDAPGPNVRVH